MGDKVLYLKIIVFLIRVHTVSDKFGYVLGSLGQ